MGNLCCCVTTSKLNDNCGGSNEEVKSWCEKEGCVPLVIESYDVMTATTPTHVTRTLLAVHKQPPVGESIQVTQYSENPTHIQALSNRFHGSIEEHKKSSKAAHQKAAKRSHKHSEHQHSSFNEELIDNKAVKKANRHKSKSASDRTGNRNGAEIDDGSSISDASSSGSPSKHKVRYGRRNYCATSSTTSGWKSKAV